MRETCVGVGYVVSQCRIRHHGQNELAYRGLEDDLGCGSEAAQDGTCGYVRNWDPFGFPNYENFISAAVGCPLRMAFGQYSLHFPELSAG
jgi:hypothetical protein